MCRKPKKESILKDHPILIWNLNLEVGTIMELKIQTYTRIM